MPKSTATNLRRCPWAESDPLLRAYHDEEWGVPQRDSRALWEMLMLEGFQAGLSWITILRKREAFREAFMNFDPAKIANFGKRDVARLMNNAGIVRSRAKIEATIKGARIFLDIEEDTEKTKEDFSRFVWNIAGGKPIQNKGPVPASTQLSEEMSKALKVIVYAWMQAVGMVNDHTPACFRRKQVGS
jgi:DNA-3-methyladenine glycosylase I